MPQSTDPQSLKLGDFRQLSIDDRIRLAQDVWHSIAEDPSAPAHMPPWHQQELDHRYAKYLQDGDKGRSWEEVRQSILERRCQRAN